MKGKHLPENLRVAEKKDYITQIELLKNEVEILKRAVGASAEEVQRLRIICELNGIDYARHND